MGGTEIRTSGKRLAVEVELGQQQVGEGQAAGLATEGTAAEAGEAALGVEAIRDRSR